ncbi:LysR family transcriptional regulator [Nonomuraea sp. NPDC049758]|uniref:LysR family transcriptional regulator n=1 Tax=Nonomuraea sp. NPDC049758 TaxID=3154360 RepID=UPI003440241C
MELRDIEIFMTLADELHFGRTAERLYVSQARISQAISRQERRLGALLFDRSNRRNVRLTPLGCQLRDDLRPVYASMRDSLERARLAARRITSTLRVGMIPGNIHYLRDYWEAFRARHPQWELRFGHAPFTDPFAVLRNGELDVLITWLPIEEDDLTVGPTLFTDSRLLGVSTDHQLAARSSISIEMLADFQMSSASMPPYWGAGLVPLRTPGGRELDRGPLVTVMDELLTLMSIGDIFHLFPAHATPYWSRPDLIWRPVNGLPAMRFALVWRTDAENDAIRALAGIVSDLPQRELADH